MISFGTDGYRGIFADTFTFKEVEIISAALADYLNQNFEHPNLIIGYDTRFLSDEFASRAGQVLASSGVKCLLTPTFVTTPMVSQAVHKLKTKGGVMVTASHNPSQYNGYKYKAPFGGSATPEITAKIEESLRKVISGNAKIEKISIKEAESNGMLEWLDLKDDYIHHIFCQVNGKIIQDNPLKVAVDSMYGTTQRLLAEILTTIDCQVTEIHDVPDPNFGGLHPEPMERNLKDLIDLVKVSDIQVGLATDGDGDRAGAVDSSGLFINSHMIFALLIKYFVEERGMKGRIVKTVSTSQIVDLLCRKYELPLEITPVGFKYIADWMLKAEVLVGGEESGGLGVIGNIPERDGILINLLLVEFMAKAGKTLGELMEEIWQETGRFYYDRRDYKTTPEAKNKLIEYLDNGGFEKDSGWKVLERVTIDGYKYLLPDESWIMIRPSGTEAVVRVYCEARSLEEVNKLLDRGEEIVKEFG